MIQGNGQTILLVDDEDSIRVVIEMSLRANGYRGLTATNGAEAVAAYAEHRAEISVVLMDLNMPVMDGPSAIRALMRMNPTVKIIAVSGLGADRSVAEVSAAGVKHFLMKPFTKETLLPTIQVLR